MSLQPESREYYFLSKHFEILKETLSKPLPEKEGEEAKLKNDLENEDEKSPPIKLKLMSLLTLVKEFASGKYSKLKNNN